MVFKKGNQYGKGNKGNKAWNKGLNKRNDKRIENYAKKLSKTLIESGAGKMEKNNNWRGGKNFVGENGYIYIKKPEHPHSKVNGYITEHRLVVEKKIKRYLQTKETIHHIDFNRRNNKINNLHLCKSKEEHNTIHKQNIPKLIIELYKQGFVGFRGGKYYLKKSKLKKEVKEDGRS